MLVPVMVAGVLSPIPLKAQGGLGAGLSSLPCTKIIERSDDQGFNDWVNFWMKGLWTGLNLAAVANEARTKDLSDPKNDQKALKARVLAYCYENPDSLLLDITLKFYTDLTDHPIFETP